MDHFLREVESCLEVLKKGGIILYPTDTVWGLGCDATNAEAVENLYRLKLRQGSKSMVVLLADARDILKYVSQVDLQVFDYLETVQKPTTIIYEGAVGIADNVIGSDGTVAIRLVQEVFCRNLIKRFRKPIVSTSANISGFPAPALFSEISAEIKQNVDYIVEYRREDTTRAAPSALVKWNKHGTVTVIRE